MIRLLARVVLASFSIDIRLIISSETINLESIRFDINYSVDEIAETISCHLSRASFLVPAIYSSPWIYSKGTVSLCVCVSQWYSTSLIRYHP